MDQQDLNLEQHLQVARAMRSMRASEPSVAAQHRWTQREGIKRSDVRCVACLWAGQRCKFTHRGARTHDHKVKGLALYRLS